MDPTTWIRILGLALIGSTRLAGFAAKGASAAATANTRPCVSSEYKQFDFWIGNWDAFDIDDPTTEVARVEVDRILDGCVLHEQYDATDGSRGQSFSIYDASRKLWRQSWVTNRGKSLVIEGQIKAGAMILSATDRSLGGPTLVRGTWKPVNGGVREVAVRSINNGKTWKPWFDLMFRPAPTTEGGNRTCAHHPDGATRSRKSFVRLNGTRQIR